MRGQQRLPVLWGGGRSGEGDISCQGLYPKSNGRGQRVNPEVVVSCVP